MPKIGGHKLQKIREAVDRASRDYGLKHHFASRYTTFLFDNEIWIQPDGQTLTQLSGKGYGQKGITTVIERFYKDVSFDAKTGFADKYKAFERHGPRIVMDPKMRFGEPLLDDCGCTPFAPFEAAKIEGSPEAAAKMYGVTPEQVETCIDYIDYLEGA